MIPITKLCEVDFEENCWVSAKAARLIELLEAGGYISKPNDSGIREVLA
jgi:hypothetical protein